MKKTEITKTRIIDVAVRLFNTLGYEKTSMDDIARFANKAKRSLYYHFTSKEEIFQSAVAQELTTIKEQLEPLFTDESQLPSQVFRSYFKQRMALFSASRVYPIVLGYEFSERHTLPYENFHSCLSKFEQWEHEQFLHVCERLPQKEGNNPVALTDMLQMLIKSLDTMFFVQGKYNDYKDTFLFTVNEITKGIELQIRENNQTI
ncbi:MAG: TetR/AcrR family transcriptional regulator [Bacteroidales bacterium]|nr:TetR/AcrR family transcriptional regulator [Bacteroidales bacterium]